MQVHADRVSVTGPHGTLMPPTSLTVAAGQLAVLHGEPGAGLTAFGLALAGRFKPATGTITGPAKLREASAVVDAPGVSEPDGALSLSVVAGEELALARRPSSKEDVRRWLAANDVGPFADTRFENLEPVVRTRLLTTLAASRKGVELLVLDTPDRHTSDVDSWVSLAREHAERGLAVVVLSATTPASALPFTPARAGELAQPEPEQCAPLPAPGNDTEDAEGEQQ
ncbi:ABC transporter ATP-binding protein [Amycolatopsis albispora]|uniref:ABC transporter ATP-binding protein n=1 Tax=Amycolatopsis albispora TaxID=1804986 RepID=A0A344L6I0_9PSEU|nr:ABC transporter ATP-binding protein [Amycolatopsis albispora]AXB43654.1 ABC transporter ATP-binding protein [Amycolatopsis albispora]